jgi:hypothetical protein
VRKDKLGELDSKLRGDGRQSSEDQSAESQVGVETAEVDIQKDVREVSESGSKKNKKHKKLTKSQKCESLATKALSGNPAKRGEVVAELSKKSSAVSAAVVKATKFSINPTWLVPTMLGLMVIGVLWIVIFYLTASIGGYPVPALRYGNLAAGFGLIIVGFGLSTKWK